MCLLNCWAQRRTGNNPTKWRLAKYWFLVWKKKAKRIEVFKSIDSNECSPLSTHTFTDQKPPKKLRWTFFYGQTFGKKLLSFPYVWTGRIGKVLSPSGVFSFFLIIEQSQVSPHSLFSWKVRSAGWQKHTDEQIEKFTVAESQWRSHE